MTTKKPKKKRSNTRESSASTLTTPNPVTLEEAQKEAQVIVRERTLGPAVGRASHRASVRGIRRAFATNATLASVGAERKKLELKHSEEIDARILEYNAVFAIMQRRGIKGITPSPQAGRRRAGRRAGFFGRARAATALPPLQILAEGDSWFDYPVPLFGGGVIPRLQTKLGVPILNLAKAGDEVRFMLGVKQLQILRDQLGNGGPTGKPWDVLLFSGGGNDIVDNPMALWIRDFDSALPLSRHIHQRRFGAALQIVLAGYEDLIEMRDRLSPKTHLLLHAYDFVIPDGRGICNLGPWLKPTFDLRRFPTLDDACGVMKAMMQQFARMLTALAAANRNVTFLNGQGTLAPVAGNWHNELHPSKQGFTAFADLFHRQLKALFPGRVL